VSTLTYAMADSGTMLRRNLRHMTRNPTMISFVIGIPVILMLLFVYVFGGTLGAGLDGGGSRADYANYLAPGILVLAVASGGQAAAISVAVDMTEGIIARLRTMAIGRAAVLNGHVLGTLLQTLLGAGAVLGVARLVGFEPTAGPAEWVAVIGLLVLMTLAFTWLCVALGLAAGSVETASNLPMPLFLLPFLGSGFTPTESMPDGVRWFAENQPFTPFTETLRGLLLGTGIGNDGYVAVAWCLAITVLGYLWATSLYDRRRTTGTG
jgi:ABC-2 type transport system permease protein